MILIGIVGIALVILVFNSSKLFQNIPSLDVIKEKIDHATSDKYMLNSSKSVIRGMSIEVKLKDNITSTDSKNAQFTNLNNVPITVYQISPTYLNQQNYTGQVFEKHGNTCEISVPALAQTVNGQKELTRIIQLGQCSLNIDDPVQVTVRVTKPDDPSSSSSGLQITPFSTVRSTSLPHLPDYYNVVKLSTINQGTNVMLNFDDSSGQTKSVTVTMRNSDSILFTGTFYSSKFSTEVKDVPNTPHIIEMSIDNAIYGILHASAYAPSNSQNSTITGILSK